MRLVYHQTGMLAGAFVWLAAIGLSVGEQVELKDGGRFSGRIVEESLEFIQFETEGRVVQFSKEQIARIDGKPVKVDFVALYEQRTKGLAARDVAAHVRLAEWCKARGLHRQVALEVLAIVQVEPQQERVRGLLGDLREGATAEEVWAHALVAYKGFPDYPDFSFGIFGKLIELVPESDVKKRMALYDAAFQVYQPRPDLGVRLRLAQGDYLARNGHRKLAYAAYYDAIERYLSQGRLVAEVTRKVVKMHQEDREPRRALDVLLKLIPLCKSPPPDDPFAGHSAYYQLHKLLAQLYRDNGNESAAAAAEEVLRRFVYAR